MSLNQSVTSWIQSSPLDVSLQTRLIHDLESNVSLALRVNKGFEAGSNEIPLIILNDYKDGLTVLFSNTSQQPQEPGEPGSILAYIRAYQLDDSFLCSDCYGQLSCSSCAIEVLKGTLENNEPREEEYDMLDIDDLKPSTTFTRLGCQAVVGTDPLLITIRKPLG